MYGLAWEKRPIVFESDAFLYNLGDPNLDDRVGKIVKITTF